LVGRARRVSSLERLFAEAPEEYIAIHMLVIFFFNFFDLGPISTEPQKNGSSGDAL
jgi:hypothetical protein